MKRFDYLRVSVTDRCNLRCLYCMPSEGIRLKPKSDILTLQEIAKVVEVSAELGVTKVRLTGGEPLVRKGLVALVEHISSLPSIDDLALTTNGVLLEEMAEELKCAGLRRVTVSMDTLDPEMYEKITRRRLLHRVLAGIEAAGRAGLNPIKINVVVLKDLNDKEVPAFASWALERGLEVRFIELMPVYSLPAACCEAPGATVRTSMLKDMIESELGRLEPVTVDPRSPARVYRPIAGQGRIGFISPMTQPFCSACSRLRLTADGKIRPCLASDLEFDVKQVLRGEGGDSEVRKVIERAVAAKPGLSGTAGWRPGSRTMCEIGG